MNPQSLAVTDYEGIYEVDSDGKIWSLNYHREHRRGEVTGKLDKDGYVSVGLRKDGKRWHLRAHRLVAQAFIPNPDNLPEVNHKNGIKNDNRVKNLEWMTTKQNIQHAWRELNIPHKDQTGEKNHATKLTNDKVIAIWNTRKTALRQREVAQMFHVSEDVVSMIYRQVNWKSVTDEYENLRGREEVS